MTDKTANVRASELHYTKRANKIYDDEIGRAIPGYAGLHKRVVFVIRKHAKNHKTNNVLELGVGTGITSEKIMRIIPSAPLTAIDCSKKMLDGAKRRLKKHKVKYILGDYSKLKFGDKFDLVLSVISIHHLINAEKKKLFKKIFKCLNSGGIFIFGDLATHRDKKKAAASDALHYHHLVENTRNSRALKEWAYHHRFVNLPAPVEDQIVWLKKAGFSSVKLKYEHFNTVLIVAKK